MPQRTNSCKAALLVHDRKLADEISACLGDVSISIVFESPSIAGINSLPQRFAPDLVIAQTNSGHASVTQLVQDTKAAFPGAEVIVAGVPDGLSILEAMRAGARDYVYTPLNVALAAALERFLTDHARADRDDTGGHTIGFVSAKGGCGATTIACHFAAELRRLTTNPVLLADLDFDAGVVAFLTKAEVRYTVQDALQNTHRLDPDYWKGLISNRSGVDVIVSPAPSLGPLSDYLETLKDVVCFTAKTYPWTVADLGRGMSPALRALGPALDEIAIIATPDAPGLHQASGLADALLETGIGRDRLKLVLNRSLNQFACPRREAETRVGLKVAAELPECEEEITEALLDGALLSAKSWFVGHLTPFVAECAGLPPVAPPQRERNVLSWIRRRIEPRRTAVGRLLGITDPQQP